VVRRGLTLNIAGLHTPDPIVTGIEVADFVISLSIGQGMPGFIGKAVWFDPNLRVSDWFAGLRGRYFAADGCQLKQGPKQQEEHWGVLYCANASAKAR
jgi:hypothetical protein